MVCIAGSLSLRNNLLQQFVHVYRIGSNRLVVDLALASAAVEDENVMSIFLSVDRSQKGSKCVA